MAESILIIGAGIAGLSAGCYGQMNGYKTRIFELHDKPGGLCTSWKRKGYTFDGCIEWLIGTRAGSPVNRMWQELGAAQDRRFIDHDVILRVEESDGRAFSVYTDIDLLEQHMKELSPADSALIEEFCHSAHRLAQYTEITNDFDKPASLLDVIKTTMRILPFMGVFQKYGTMPGETFFARFSDPFLRRALMALYDWGGGGTGCPVMGVMYMLAYLTNRNGGYPVGGSLAFAQAIERRYLDLGGEVNYRARVEKILVEPGPAGRPDRAVGIRLSDGSEHRADIVISAADGHATIFDMLEGRYVSDKVRGYYKELPTYPSWVQVSLGVARDLSDEAVMVSYLLDEPIDIAGEKVERIEFHHFCMDPTMAPPGKSAVVMMFMSDYAYWKALHTEPERYEAEKKEIAAQVIDRLERRLPGISEQIEVVDVSTPMTVERYTGNWQGSQQGWLIKADMDQRLLLRGMDKTLPGLEGFYMCGQWVEPGGGLPTSAGSGRNLIGIICKKDKKKFGTSLPSMS